MMTTIACLECGAEIELSEALTKDIEKSVLAAEHKKHQSELERVRREAAVQAKQDSDQALEIEKKKLIAAAETAQKAAKEEIELERKKMQSDLAIERNKSVAENKLELDQLKAEADSEKAANKELRERLTELMTQLREERKAKENAELEMQRQLSDAESKIREEAAKNADEKYRLKLAESEKKLQDTQKALDEAQRKAAQGSQQLQGEILELDIEETLRQAFRDDDIEPVAKGKKGSDITHVVKSPRGTPCGVILWEIKRTKHWTESWISTIKSNLRDARANVPVIISNVMPKEIQGAIGYVEGVWVCKPDSAVILCQLLRKGLLDVGLQKALAQNRGTKADALYGYVTSHEFVNQVEAMVETFADMKDQVQKERVAYEKFWAIREAQAHRLLTGTANVVGGMIGNIGSSAMPKIKGLELPESGQDLQNPDTRG